MYTFNMATAKVKTRVLKKITPKKKVAPKAKPKTKPTKTEKKGKLHATEKQRRLMELILENSLLKEPRLLKDLMIDAGYSESTARARSGDIMRSLKQKEGTVEVLDRLKALREKIIKRMENSIDGASFGNATFGLQAITKTVELLEGRPTDRVEHRLSDEDKEELDRILGDNS